MKIYKKITRMRGEFELPLQRVPLRGFIVLMPIIINLG